MTKAQLETKLRNECLELLYETLDNKYGYDVLFVSASEITLPVIDAEGNEISVDAYDQLFNDYESSSTDKVYLCWFNEISLSNLENSYMMFTGE